MSPGILAATLRKAQAESGVSAILKAGAVAQDVEVGPAGGKPMEAAATGDKSARKPHNHGTHRGGRGRGRGNGGAKNDKPSDPQ